MNNLMKMTSEFSQGPIRDMSAIIRKMAIKKLL